MKKRIVATAGREHVPPQMYVVDSEKDFHFKYGIIKKEDLQKPDGSVVKTSAGKPYYVFSPSGADTYGTIKRSAQIPLLKDIAVVLAYTGIGKDSVVAESGSGSGGFSCFIAPYVKKVFSYDIDEDAINLVGSNAKMLGIKNIEAKNTDIYNSIPDKNFDLFFIDVPEPWKALENIKKAAKPGAYIVSYSPSIVQSQQFVNSALKDESLFVEKTVELVEREWKIKDQAVRPVSKSTLHSGFLTFVRKMGK